MDSSNRSKSKHGTSSRHRDVDERFETKRTDLDDVRPMKDNRSTPSRHTETTPPRHKDSSAKKASTMPSSGLKGVVELSRMGAYSDDEKDDE
jgi:hypothetical protein